MKHLKTFESYNKQLINENLFSYLFKSLGNNNDVKKGMEMVSDFFNKNPQELEDLKRKTSSEIGKFNEGEIEEFSSKLTKLKDPVQDMELKDAAEKAISELNESTVVSNAIKYLAQKLLDFIGVGAQWLGFITMIVQTFVGAIFADGGKWALGLQSGIFISPWIFIGAIIGSILLIISGSKITDYTQGKYDPRTNTTSPGSLDQFSGEHTMRYN